MNFKRQQITHMSKCQPIREVYTTSSSCPKHKSTVPLYTATDSRCNYSWNLCSPGLICPVPMEEAEALRYSDFSLLHCCFWNFPIQSPGRMYNCCSGSILCYILAYVCLLFCCVVIVLPVSILSSFIVLQERISTYSFFHWQLDHFSTMWSVCQLHQFGP